jgi:hypothetical protein
LLDMVRDLGESPSMEVGELTDPFDEAEEDW